MGSFNRTCFLTHTPILAGDPVVGFFVLPGHHRRHSAIHATEYGIPVHGPLRGAYNDYGWMDADAGQDVVVQVLDHTLSHTCVVADAGEGTTHPYEAGRATLEGIYDLVHGGHLLATTHSRFHKDGQVALVAALCHADAWDALAATPLVGWDDEATTVPRMMAEADTLLDVVATKTAPRQIPEDEDLPVGWELLVRPNIRGLGLRSAGPAAFAGLAHAVHLVASGAPEQANRLLTGLAELVLVTHHMDTAHRSWLPAIGAAQEEDWDLCLTLSRLATTLLERGRAACMGDDEDDL